MSFVSIPEMLWPATPSSWATTPTISASASADINGAGQWVAWVGRASKTATLDRFIFYIGYVSTGCDVQVRIETVDTATGLPTGTLVHANATADVTIPGAGEYAGNFAGTFDVTKGDTFAMVIVYVSGSPVAVRIGIFLDDGSEFSIPYVIDYDTTATARLDLALCLGLGIYGGGALPMMKAWPMSSVAVETFNSSSSPDTYGNRITLSVPLRVCGAWYWADQDGTATLKLYDVDGATVLASVALEVSVPPTTGAAVCPAMFSSSVELPAGDYFIAIEATSGTNVGISTMSFASSGWREGSPHGGANIAFASTTQTPTEVGHWTVNDTKQAFIGLIIDGIEAADGGGETAHVFMA